MDTAVDDHCHDLFTGDEANLATTMSVGDLHKQMAESSSQEVAIPSVQWIRLQFWPRRANAA